MQTDKTIEYKDSPTTTQNPIKKEYIDNIALSNKIEQARRNFEALNKAFEIIIHMETNKQIPAILGKEILESISFNLKIMREVEFIKY